MAGFIIWTMTMALSVGLLVITAAIPSQMLNTVIAAAVSLAMAAGGVRELLAAEKNNQNVHVLGALAARFMGLIWAWGAVALTVLYQSVLEWKEWWYFALAFAGAAILCVVFANLLAARSPFSKGPQRVFKLSRVVVLVQLAGMMAVVVGLLVDGKMDFAERDWAANNVFFFGAAALLIISAMSVVITARIARKHLAA